MRFVLLSFLFMGWAFYELSGGADFQPGRPDDQGAVADARPAVTEPVTGGLSPVQEKVAVIIVAPQVARVMPVPAQTGDPAQASEPGLAFRINQPGADSDAASLQLASLADSGAAFFQPLFLAPSVAPAEAAQTAEATGPDATPTDIRRISGSRVNMRQGPGTTYPVIGSLYFDDRVEVIEDPGAGWVRLRSVGDDRVGWMAARFLRAADG